jgi:hypothetical protein
MRYGCASCQPLGEELREENLAQLEEGKTLETTRKTIAKSKGFSKKQSRRARLGSD